MDSLNLAKARQAELVTRLSPEECVARLKPRLTPWYRLNQIRVAFVIIHLGKREDLAGTASRDGFRVELTHPRRMTRRRTYIPIQARGRFIPTPDGTRIPVQIGLSQSGALSDWLIPGVVFLVTGLMFLFMGFGIAISSAFAVLFAAFIFFINRGITEREVRQVDDQANPLLRLLCAALEAEEVPPTAGGAATRSDGSTGVTGGDGSRYREMAGGGRRIRMSGEARFCEHCGAAMHARARFCGGCGRPPTLDAAAGIGEAETVRPAAEPGAPAAPGRSGAGTEA